AGRSARRAPRPGPDQRRQPRRAGRLRERAERPRFSEARADRHQASRPDPPDPGNGGVSGGVMEKPMPLRRREFLSRGVGLFSVGFVGPELLTAMARASADPTRPANPILVMVQMNGGNDGLNTVIPYADPLYYSNRPTLGIPQSQVVPVSATHGLHPG